MELDDIFSDEIDPEIAKLLSDEPVVVSGKKTSLAKKDSAKDFGTMFSNMDVNGQEKQKSATKVDLSVRQFDKIEKFFEEKGHDLFKAPDYYKLALQNEGETSQKLHGLMQRFLSCQDPKDRAIFRQKIIVVYWDLLKTLVPKVSNSNPISQKKYLLRFGMLLPSLLTEDQRTLFSKTIETNTYGEPVYYVDEWMRDIASGLINPSATDEAKVKKSDENSHTQQLLNRANGKLQSAENLLKAKSDERSKLEATVKSKIEDISRHDTVKGFMHIKAPYSDAQKKIMAEISESMRDLAKMDRELINYINDFEQATADVRTISERLEQNGGVGVNTQSAVSELDTIKQMTKMTVGRQGNHFPILMKEYFHNTPRDIGVRENVLNILAWIESIDKEAYCRSYKNQLNRIVPYTILIPSYGDLGVCWEPFDRYNRVTSRGRIAVPMYSKNLTLAVLTAVGDLRWQVAKEKASYYWMEEGLTGNYYQFIQAQKIKGDLKELFINDYVLWMTKESDGVQRLDKEVRGIFWRYMPFSKEVKEKLKTRSYVYQELCQRDANREMSDGY